MILPDKDIYLSNSLLGLGAVLLPMLKARHTVSSLWEKTKALGNCGINSYEKYILTLDLLYALNLIELENGVLRRVKP